MGASTAGFRFVENLTERDGRLTAVQLHEHVPDVATRQVSVRNPIVVRCFSLLDSNTIVWRDVSRTALSFRDTNRASASRRICDSVILALRTWRHL